MHSGVVRKESVPGRDDSNFISIGDWNGDFRDTNFKEVIEINEKWIWWTLKPESQNFLELGLAKP